MSVVLAFLRIGSLMQALLRCMSGAEIGEGDGQIVPGSSQHLSLPPSPAWTISSHSCLLQSLAPRERINQRAIAHKFYLSKDLQFLTAMFSSSGSLPHSTGATRGKVELTHLHVCKM